MRDTAAHSPLPTRFEAGQTDEVARKLMGEREAARAEKDFERADRIRDELATLGWEVRDSADGAKLVPKS